MSAAWLQFIASGLTAGAIYALVALGFTIVFNASGAINFAQGEFVMVGGMSAATLVAAGVSLPLAILLALAAAIVVALVIERVAISPARHAGTVTLIIITIGVSLFLRGLAQLVWGKGVFRLPAFSGEEPIAFAGATLLPQSLWDFCDRSVHTRFSALGDEDRGRLERDLLHASIVPQEPAARHALLIECFRSRQSPSSSM